MKEKLTELVAVWRARALRWLAGTICRVVPSLAAEVIAVYVQAIDCLRGEVGEYLSDEEASISELVEAGRLKACHLGVEAVKAGIQTSGGLVRARVRFELTSKDADEVEIATARAALEEAVRWCEDRMTEAERLRERERQLLGLIGLVERMNGTGELVLGLARNGASPFLFWKVSQYLIMG